MIMKLVFLLLTTLGVVRGTAIISAQSGDWSSTSTWVGGVVPGNGDTVTIANTHTVTVSDSRIVGSSPNTGGTPAVALGNSGVLQITSGGSIKVRGDIAVTGVFLETTGVQVDGGGTFTWDGTQNIDAQYKFFGTVLVYRKFVGNGSS